MGARYHVPTFDQYSTAGAGWRIYVSDRRRDFVEDLGGGEFRYAREGRWHPRRPPTYLVRSVHRARRVVIGRAFSKSGVPEGRAGQSAIVQPLQAA